ncbi:hypothetical protein [Serratia sp. UGAL515B_01]|nr:hypothetical protein [Serratia sp. UGAL515B_01]WON78844.1 hypothetical protein OK023_09610 [Serratia sp. UGAL515B_01]
MNVNANDNSYHLRNRFLMAWNYRESQENKSAQQVCVLGRLSLFDVSEC